MDGSFANHITGSACKMKYQAKPYIAFLASVVDAWAAQTPANMGICTAVALWITQGGRTASLKLQHEHDIARARVKAEIEVWEERVNAMEDALKKAGFGIEASDTRAAGVKTCSSRAVEALMRDHKIIKRVAGSYTGKLCNMILKGPLLDALDVMIATPASKALTDHLRGYRFINDVAVVLQWTPKAFQQLNAKHPSVSPATVPQLAAVLKDYTRTWAQALFDGSPATSCQHYLHVIVMHAHQQLITMGSIGLYASTGIEAAHIYLKKLTRESWTSADIASLSQFLLTRWRAKVNTARSGGWKKKKKKV